MRRWTGLILAMALAGCERAPTADSPRPQAPETHEVSGNLPSLTKATREMNVPFALVELFTSEGCSSCPPADEALAAITERAERTGERVYTLELHVDYWDDLGWKDPFSSESYSERQKAYAAKLGLAQIFTPQMVVNGRRQLIGSRRKEAEMAIAEALRMPAALDVGASARRGSRQGDVQVDYDVAGCPRVCGLTVALVQDHAETVVQSGENAHRTLAHRHVVRALSTRTLAGDGRGTLVARWPDRSNEAAQAVAIVSDLESGAILGARAVTIERG